MECILALGTNVGSRKVNLEIAQKRIFTEVGIITNKSSIFESEAWGVPDQPDFLNQIIVVETQLLPIQVLCTIKEIEQNMGRKKVGKWGPRIIDIDILFCEKLIINSKELIVPHPGIPFRNFILVPLMEILPDYIHPVKNITIEEMYWECDDVGNVYINESI